MVKFGISALVLDSFIDPSGITDVLFSLISFAVIFAILSVVLYVAGNIVVGRKRTCMKDAFCISVLGTLVLIVCNSVFSFEIASVLSLIAWLLLVRYYYETDVLGSIAVGVASVVISIVILYILSFGLGYSLFFSWLPVFIGV
ncbi:MAG: hypothetical protein QCH99_00650 [Candidatus Bathyarchaeota archaeon]|nr:hypothetical protein [Candidatus Bathyarchaeum tardum]WGM89432.1 MAG: hypothetical protein NUK63_11105 [Candidatus Bathyarchaeum tardum]